MPDSIKPMSKSNSRRFLLGFLVLSLGLAFMAAMGIKNATENEQFQKEVMEMRRLYDPNLKKSEEAASLPASSTDSTSTTDSGEKVVN